MYFGFYSNLGSTMLLFLFWWMLLLVFHRIMNRYPGKNNLKKDMILTFIQTVAVFILLPIIYYLVDLK